MTGTRRDVRVIWNPAAGRKAGLPTNVDLAGEELEALFARQGLAPEIVATGSAAEAIARSREARDAGADVVVAAGGDGTLHVVAHELLDGGPALGILPLGSVMNVARSLGIPRDLEEAALVIATGEVRAIDVGVANGEPFLEGVAIGLHAALFEHGSRFDRGEVRAALRGIATALRYRGSRITIDLGDRTVRTRALMVSVANGPYSGLGFTVAPGALMDDGLLDVRVFERFSRMELLRHFGAIVAGRRAYEPRVATYRSRAVEIGSASPLPARADGDPLGGTPVTCSVLPGALRVVVPGSMRHGPEPRRER